jgi:hypothetical protein
MTKAELTDKIERLKKNKLVPEGLKATLLAKYEKQLGELDEKAPAKKAVKAKAPKKAKAAKAPKEKKPAPTYKGKKLTDLDEADCEELLASIKERRAAAKKSSKKSASKPVIEKIAGNIATAVKQAVETVTATEIKKNPKKENAKMKQFAMFIKKAFETAAKKFLGSDYKQGTVNNEFKPIFDLINEITKKYE